jgi:hypothetical protein
MLCLEFSLSFSEYKAFCTSTGLLAEFIVVYFQDKDFDGEFEWCIHDLTQQCIYKVTNLWLGTEALEAGYVTSYSCNTILLLEWPKPSVVTSCAIVLVQGVVPRKLGDERDRMLCEVKKRLLLREITKVELNKRNKTLKIVNAKFGRMRVKIV